jgi:hypothetical protein
VTVTGRLCGAALAAAGIAMLVGGLVVSWQAWKTGPWIAEAYRIPGGGPVPAASRLAAALAALDGQPGVDAAAARMHLHYAAAWQAPDRLEWRRQLLAALGDGREALAADPARADVSLLLAEIEFTLFGPGEWVYAPLRLSIATAPAERWVIEWRIGLDLKLVATAPSDLQAGIARDVRVIGEPGLGLGYYQVLARAAFAAGPAAIAFVRRELAPQHSPWPLDFFDKNLAALKTGAKLVGE